MKELRFTDKTLSLRSIKENDTELLFQIYSSTRDEELEKVTSWTSVQKHLFLQQQFNAQHTYYQHNYTGANFWIIERKQEPLGRLYLHTAYTDNSIRIIDITLLPKWRTRGIGSGILKDIIHFAHNANRSVTIHVETFNPALHLYKKLGFEIVDKANEVYLLMECTVCKYESAY